MVGQSTRFPSRSLWVLRHMTNPIEGQCILMSFGRRHAESFMTPPEHTARSSDPTLT